MARRDKQPAPIVRKTVRGLSPVHSRDAEAIMRDPPGTEYDLIKRTKRSNPQNALYWQTLTNVVRATDKWPSAEHLHDELKLVCGFKRTIVDWDTGRVSITTDSTAFDAMKQDEFQNYFNRAMAKLAEHVGFDVLAYTEAA